MAFKKQKAKTFQRVSFSLNSDTGCMTVEKLHGLQLLVSNKTGKVHDRSTVIHHLLELGAIQLCKQYDTELESLKA